MNIRTKNRIFLNINSKNIIVIILIFFILILSVITDSFFTYNNITNLLRSTSIYGVIAIGMTFVILTGGIDLSVGAIVGFSGMIMASLAQTSGINISLSITISLFLSIFIGAINGYIIYYGKVAPFIATLGSMTILRGFIKLISDAKMITITSNAFKDFSKNNTIYLPNLFWVWVLITIISCFILNNTKVGRNIYAIGSNIEAARLSGINISGYIILVYSISAFLSGIAGVMLASRLTAGVPLAGTGYELDAIAASVVGGASLLGAQGGAFSTAIGSILITIIRNGGVLLGVNPFILEIIVGLLIVSAVVIQKRSKV